MALVCVSATPLDRQVLLSGDRSLPPSLLDLEQKEHLPALLYAEITLEITRRDPALDPAERTLLAGALLDAARPMALLELCLTRIGDGIDAELPLAQRLARWQRAERIERLTPSLRTLLRLRQHAEAGWRIVGLPPPREVAGWLRDALRGFFGKGG